MKNYICFCDITNSGLCKITGEKSDTRCMISKDHLSSCYIKQNWGEALDAMNDTPINLRDVSWNKAYEEIRKNMNTCTCGLIPNKVENELKTSADWQSEFSEVKVLDPDGWDRLNFQFSWYEEKITKTEYLHRLSSSTCLGPAKKLLELGNGKVS